MPTMVFMVIVHSGGGSMAEACDGEREYGFSSEAEAVQACKSLNDAFGKNRAFDGEWWATWHKADVASSTWNAAAEIDKIVSEKFGDGEASDGGGLLAASLNPYLSGEPVTPESIRTWMDALFDPSEKHTEG